MSSKIASAALILLAAGPLAAQAPATAYIVTRLVASRRAVPQPT